MAEPDRRRKNRDWAVTSKDGDVLYNDIRDGAFLATLMDIRDELQALNALLGCGNFTGIPSTLRGIRAELTNARKAREREARNART